MRAELVGVSAPGDFGNFFDYSIVEKIYRELKTADWKPAPSPSAGQHTRAVLAEIGYSTVMIDALVTSGVVKAAP